MKLIERIKSLIPPSAEELEHARQAQVTCEVIDAVLSTLRISVVMKEQNSKWSSDSLANYKKDVRIAEDRRLLVNLITYANKLIDVYSDASGDVSVERWLGDPVKLTNMGELAEFTYAACTSAMREMALHGGYNAIEAGTIDYDIACMKVVRQYALVWLGES